MKIGNKYGDTILACVKCGVKEELTPIAHRNKKGNVTGSLYVCQKCFDSVSGGDIIVKFEDKPMIKTAEVRRIK